jgi:hypothetical protein
MVSRYCAVVTRYQPEVARDLATVTRDLATVTRDPAIVARDPARVIGERASLDRSQSKVAPYRCGPVLRRAKAMARGDCRRSGSAKLPLVFANG